MDKEQPLRAAARAHALNMENREKAAVTGVSEVLAFDETQVTLLTDVGEMTVLGENLHVTRLMLEEGQLTVEGRIDALSYAEHTQRRGIRRFRR